MEQYRLRDWLWEISCSHGVLRPSGTREMIRRNKNVTAQKRCALVHPLVLGGDGGVTELRKYGVPTEGEIFRSKWKGGAR